MKEGALAILHFSTADILGGSAKAATRIHQGLAAAGHRSRMLVRYKQSNDETIESIWPRGPARLWDRAWDALSTRSGLQYIHVPSSARAIHHRWVRDADIIQLYNIHGGYLSPADLPRLSHRAPLVWRLSDIWPATGHCAYSGACERWREGCGHCPDLGAYPPVRRDATAYLWRRKRVAYAKSNITFVAPSSWMEDIVRASPLLRDFPCVRIATGVDEDQFNMPLAEATRVAARTELDIPENATVILFAAHILDGNPRKGGQNLVAALNLLGAMPNCLLLLAGVGGQSWREAQPLDLRLAGYRSEPDDMAKIYAAADFSVTPSLDENLANTVLESMACGRPVVAFNAGGTRDAVRHMETGYLAAAGDNTALANGIKQFVDSKELRQRIGRGASELVSREFGQSRQTERFANLYHDILAGRSALSAKSNL